MFKIKINILFMVEPEKGNSQKLIDRNLWDIETAFYWHYSIKVSN